MDRAFSKRFLSFSRSLGQSMKFVNCKLEGDIFFFFFSLFSSSCSRPALSAELDLVFFLVVEELVRYPRSPPFNFVVSYPYIFSLSFLHFRLLFLSLTKFLLLLPLLFLIQLLAESLSGRKNSGEARVQRPPII